MQRSGTNLFLEVVCSPGMFTGLEEHLCSQSRFNPQDYIWPPQTLWSDPRAQGGVIPEYCLLWSLPKIKNMLCRGPSTPTFPKHVLLAAAWSPFGHFRNDMIEANRYPQTDPPHRHGWASSAFFTEHPALCDGLCRNKLPSPAVYLTGLSNNIFPERRNTD